MKIQDSYNIHLVIREPLLKIFEVSCVKAKSCMGMHPNWAWIRLGRKKNHYLLVKIIISQYLTSLTEVLLFTIPLCLYFCDTTWSIFYIIIVASIFYFFSSIYKSSFPTSLLLLIHLSLKNLISSQDFHYL